LLPLFCDVCSTSPTSDTDTGVPSTVTVRVATQPVTVPSEFVTTRSTANEYGPTTSSSRWEMTECST